MLYFSQLSCSSITSLTTQYLPLYPWSNSSIYICLSVCPFFPISFVHMPLTSPKPHGASPEPHRESLWHPPDRRAAWGQEQQDVPVVCWLVKFPSPMTYTAQCDNAEPVGPLLLTTPAISCKFTVFSSTGKATVLSLFYNKNHILFHTRDVYS